MKQQTFSDIEYSNRKKKTKKEEFLDAMDQIIPHILISTKKNSDFEELRGNERKKAFFGTLGVEM